MSYEFKEIVTLSKLIVSFSEKRYRKGKNLDPLFRSGLERERIWILFSEVDSKGKEFDPLFRSGLMCRNANRI